MPQLIYSRLQPLHKALINRLVRIAICPPIIFFSLILILFLAKQKFERVLNIIKDLDYSDKISLFEIRQSLHQHKGGFSSVYRVQVGERDLAVKIITLGYQYTNPVDNDYVCDIPFILFRPVSFVFLFY